MNRMQTLNLFLAVILSVVTLNKDPLFLLLLIISLIGILGYVDMPNLLKLLRTELLFPQSYHKSDFKDSVVGFPGKS